MKKSLSMLALAAFLFSMNGVAQEKPKEKEVAKKECSMKDKKSCAKGKASCCAKKAEKKV